MLTINGYVGRFPAGLLTAWFEDEEIRISDFHVYKPLTYRLIPLIAPLSPTRTIVFRGRGLGALMMDERLCRARESGRAAQWTKLAGSGNTSHRRPKTFALEYQMITSRDFCAFLVPQTTSSMGG